MGDEKKRWGKVFSFGWVRTPPNQLAASCLFVPPTSTVPIRGLAESDRIPYGIQKGPLFSPVSPPPLHLLLLAPPLGGGGGTTLTRWNLTSGLKGKAHPTNENFFHLLGIEGKIACQ